MYDRARRALALTERDQVICFSRPFLTDEVDDFGRHLVAVHDDCLGVHLETVARRSLHLQLAARLREHVPDALVCVYIPLEAVRFDRYAGRLLRCDEHVADVEPLDKLPEHCVRVARDGKMRLPRVRLDDLLREDAGQRPSLQRHRARRGVELDAVDRAADVAAVDIDVRAGNDVPAGVVDDSKVVLVVAVCDVELVVVERADVDTVGVGDYQRMDHGGRHLSSYTVTSMLPDDDHATV